MSHERGPETGSNDTAVDAFLAGAGEMGALLRAIDWSETPLGAIAEWPQSLRTTMSICLNSRFPIAVYWGPEYLMLYNESLLPMVGARKHPLGQPAQVVLAEIWGIIEPLLRHVRTTGEATWSEDLMLPLARTGAPEESIPRRVIQRWQQSIDTGEPFEMEFPLRGADGVFRWFLRRVKPLRDDAGRIVRWIGANTNIDERRRNDDFRETFLGVLGHDLRNPLDTVLMTSRVLTLLPDTPDTVRKKLERVTSSGVRMQRMIEQLLDLTRARLTEGIPVVFSAEQIDLAALVTKIVEEIRGGHPKCTIEVDVQGVCSARVDPDRLEQVMSNLLGNALTHGDQSQPIRVALICDAEWTSLAVHNYGTPIPADFLPLLFNPFAREQTYRHASEGLGLGLYISERIVAAHGGTLSVQSSAAAGTRFEVRLPRRHRSG